MEIAIGVFLFVIVIGFASTKAEDKRIVARGETLAAPEWARWLLILVVALPFLLCLLAGAGYNP